MVSRDAGPILGLDHITLVVEALDAAVAAYEVLFDQACTARGEAAGLAWARFALANTALVLVAPRGEPSALARHVAHRPDGAQAALGALGFAVADPDGAARLLRRRGLPAAGPPLPWLDGAATPLLPDAARGLHLLLTQPGPAAAAATRLDHAVIRSGDPERTIALLAGRLGSGIAGSSAAIPPGARGCCSSAAATWWWRSRTTSPAASPMPPTASGA